MSENLHQRAKDIFGKLVDLPREAQAQELDRLCAGDTQLKREVGSLLDFHTARSLMSAPPKPKIRNRSTLNTTRLNKPWYDKSVAYLPLIGQVLLIAAAVLPLVLYLSKAVERYNQHWIEQKLASIIDQHAAHLKQWQTGVQATIQAIAANPIVGEQLAKISKAKESQANADTSAPPDFAAETLEIQRAIEASLTAPATFCLWDKQMRQICRTQFAPTVLEVPGWTPFRCADLMRAAAGEWVLRIPVQGQSNLPPPLSNHDVTAFCPIKNASGEVLATLLVQSPVISNGFEAVVERWNNAAELTESYEAYVVDGTGHLLSKIRFPENLRKLDQVVSGQASERINQTSQPAQSLLIRDPGVDLLNNGRPKTHSANWPLTRAARGISEGKHGMSGEGYRNYVGQMVSGAWRYLPEQNLGLILEWPKREAFALVHEVNGMLAILFGLCCLGTLMSLIIGWPRKRTRNLHAVGPYKIQELLGEGGMGKVYLAEHSLLCRPTAIKILTGDNVDLSVLMRFEREVQLASQLTHPNTISIYDFGRNEQGLFYYAMEYIDGGHIGQLVEFDGPLPAGRCIYLVRQLCFALREAHLAGVVHRDIKPQNVMLCDRGGEPDFIKLVDYGLVKAFAPGISDSASHTNFIIGTPRFMAPERLQSPWLADPRVDIYSIGGLLYFMLTAELPPLVAPTDSQDHVQLGVETLDLQTIAVPFSRLLSQCMSHDPATRPSSIASLLHELDLLSNEFPWQREDSEIWWKKRGQKFKQFLATKRKHVNG